MFTLVEVNQLLMKLRRCDDTLAIANQYKGFERFPKAHQVLLRVHKRETRLIGQNMLQSLLLI